MSAEASTVSPSIPVEVERLAILVMTLAGDRNLRIVTAESCTGGLLAALLTDIEGCSHAFERGFVTYTDEAKAEMLGVDDALLRTCGAVSAEVARAMATGALRASRGDIALSITGFAEASPEGGEAGLAFFGVASPGRVAQVEEHHFGDVGRGRVRIECLSAGLKLLRRSLMTL